MEPGEHISDVARRIMSVELDGARSASGATDGESVYERANEELAARRGIFVQYVPGSADVTVFLICPPPLFAYFDAS